MPLQAQGSPVMQRVRMIAVRCRVSRGAFSDELVFEIDQTGDQNAYIGAASRQYIWNEAKQHFKPDEPAEGESVPGLVAARQLGSRDASILVAIPDGEVIQVEKRLLADRPQESAPDVPLESRSALGD